MMRSTRMVTNVSRPTITVYRPPHEHDTGTAVLICPGGGAEDKDELAAGLHILAGTPPVFLAHGGDNIISGPAHSVVMYLALKRAGIPAELHVYATAAHDFGVRPSEHPCSTWTQSCATWLRHQRFLDSIITNQRKGQS
jgi:acetyl esterase/lipase